MVSFAGPLGSTVQSQPQIPATKDSDNDEQPACVYSNVNRDRYSHLQWSNVTNCNVSALNEETGIDLQHATISLKVNCHDALPSTLWNGMFKGKAILSIEIQNCIFTRFSSKAFKGLLSLVKLVIHGEYDSIPNDLCNRSMTENVLDKTEADEAKCLRLFTSHRPIYYRWICLKTNLELSKKMLSKDF